MTEADGPSVVPADPDSLPEQIAEILDPEVLRDPEARETVTRVIAAFEAVRGPLPPPSMLREYEEIVPGISHRMFRQVELQSEHRRGLENRHLDASIRRSSRGQHFALLIAMLGLLVGGFLIYEDKQIYGFGVLLSGILPIVGSFLYSQYRQHRELERKWDSLDSDGEVDDPETDSHEHVDEQLTIAAEERRRSRGHRRR